MKQDMDFLLFFWEKLVSRLKLGFHILGHLSQKVGKPYHRRTVFSRLNPGKKFLDQMIGRFPDTPELLVAERFQVGLLLGPKLLYDLPQQNTKLSTLRRNFIAQINRPTFNSVFHTHCHCAESVRVHHTTCDETRPLFLIFLLYFFRRLIRHRMTNKLISEKSTPWKFIIGQFFFEYTPPKRLHGILLDV